MPARRCARSSGGERNRVLLARLFALPANVLVLDEPTNDLDIDTLELLEDLLQKYPGTVFLVSHDRRFLDNVVTSTIAWEGEASPGLWREYEGGYEDWVVQKARSQALKREAAGAGRGGEAARAAARDSRGQAAQAQLQGAARTRRTAGAHRRARGGTAAARRAAFGRRDLCRRRARLVEAQDRIAQIENELMAALERWEALGAG